MSGVLAGLRVVDMSTTQAGAPVGQLLADNGADVLLIEPPGGSPLRFLPGFPFWARGKRSLQVDLHDQAGVDRLRELLTDADVLVETLKPGALERCGLAYEALAVSNPRLVHASITGFGSTGPLSQVNGYEGVVMAKIGGFTAFRRMSERKGPKFVSVPYCSFSAAQTALQGILTALYEREQSGVGQHVEASLAQGFAALDTWQWYINVITDKYPGAFSPAEAFSPTTGIPQSSTFFKLIVGLTQDGTWLQFSQVFPRLWQAFAKVLDLEHAHESEEWKGAPEFDDEAQRDAWWTLELEKIRERSYDQWVEVFDAVRDVWAEPYREGRELLDHPQLLHDKRVVVVDDAERGPVRQPAELVRVGSIPVAFDRGSPAVGEGGDSGFQGTADKTQSGGSAPSGRLPLEGVTILELATMFAAPYGSTVLTDLGARVFKVEPISGDLLRYLQPFPDCAAMKAMQGKESIAVDFSTEDGHQIVLELAARADVVLQSYRAGVAERLGLDDATLRRANPDLIYLNAPGYGVDGPCGDRPVFAPGIGAAAGFARRNAGPTIPVGLDLSTEEAKRASVRLFQANSPVSAQADGLAALAAATAMLLGLVGRARTGKADTLTTTMLVTAAHAVGDDMVDYPDRPEMATVDPDLWGLSAVYRIYPAAEGWVFLAAPTDREWTALVAVLGDDLAADPRFGSTRSRTDNDAALVESLTRVFATRNAADWEKSLTDAGVACVEVSSEEPERLLAGELGRAHGYVTDVEHPDHGEHVRLAPLVRFSRSATTAGPTCTAGQHTESLLREIGRTEEQIADLRSRGVVR